MQNKVLILDPSSSEPRKNIHDELVGLADGSGDASNGTPRIHNGLSTSNS